MDAQIEALHFTNAYPTDEVEQELRGRLQKHFDAVGHLDTEISALENRLKELRARRDAEQRIIDRYKPFLSPIRRMSPEILGEIFYRCLPSHRNSIIRETECPLLLTRVCSRWRAVAISEQRLWAQIYITFEDKLVDLNSSLMFSKLKSKRESKRAYVIELLHTRLDAIKEWLSRSGTRSLSISVHFTSCKPDKTCEAMRNKDHPVVLEFFEFLAQLAPRFKNLELSMPFQVYRLLESMMDVAAMTKLKSLRASIIHESWDWHSTDPMVMLMAPHLNAISIKSSTTFCDEGHTMQLLGIMDPLHLSLWRGVTDFSCHDALTPDSLVSLLEHTPNLIHFKGRISGYQDSSVRYQPRGPAGRIYLPSLRTFSIVDRTIPCGSWNYGLYNRLDAPGTTWVDYVGAIKPPKKDEVEDNTVVAFLQRLPVLKKFSVNTVEFRTSGNGLARMFKATPSITHLFCGYEERDRSGRLARTWSNRTTTNNTGFDPDNPDAFNLLTLDMLVAPLDTDTDDDLPLLPNLVSLEISERTVDITEKHLIKLITSRMRPPTSRPVVSQLKRVAVVFYRPKGPIPDVEQIIREHAERVGVDMIDLSLDYPPQPRDLPVAQPHQPEFGLDSEGRSWRHLDAEGFMGL